MRTMNMRNCRCLEKLISTQNLCDDKMNQRDLADLKRTVRNMNRMRKRGEI
jgi:hypothetical protein